MAKQKNDIILKIISIALIFLTLVAVLQLGLVGRFVDDVSHYMFGYYKYVVYTQLIFNCGYYAWKNHIFKINKTVFSLNLVIFAIFMLITVFTSNKVGMASFNLTTPNHSVGLVFTLLYAIISSLVGQFGVVLFAVILLLVGIVLYFGKAFIENKYFTTKESIKNYQEVQKSKKEEKERKMPFYDLRKAKKQESVFITLEDDNKVHHTVSDVKQDKMIIPVIEPMQPQEDGIREATPVKQQKKNDDYDLPKLDLLKEGKQKAHEVNYRKAQENSVKIIDILKQFQINAKVANISIGPTVTRFEIVPEQGVRINRIATLQHDIKMALAAKHLRIEAPIPGKSAVGIEVPNIEKEMVYMKQVMASVSNKNSKLLFVLGKDLTGNAIYGELNKMPHLLVAGSTGSGKSVCINSIITSVLLRSTPDEVRILLIDPKKVEFTPYKSIPHLVAPIITDANKAARALEVVVAEMDRRYDLFAEYGVKNMSGYSELRQKNPDIEPMPFIMVVIDELADLMLVASKKVEASIQRITQLARAAGIHLIVATQRPSVDVITGVIKSNIPSRIAFAVSSSIDSRTILDESGAEKLLGNGDMLYIPIGEQNPIRVQGVYVSDEEVESICEHTLKYGDVEYMDVFMQLEQLDSIADNGPTLSDELYVEVRNYVISTQQASASNIQARFGIGYPRANKLMNMLEVNGVIGPKNGTKPREILINN